MARIIQEDHYYPFGMRLDGLSYDYASGNKYLYNGKEFQQESGLYDYGARMYDPTIGRWTAVDALADEDVQIDKSPYASFWNNPIFFTDPDGNCPMCPGGDDVYAKGATVENSAGSWSYDGGGEWKNLNPTYSSNAGSQSSMPSLESSQSLTPVSPVSIDMAYANYSPEVKPASGAIQHTFNITDVAVNSVPLAKVASLALLPFKKLTSKWAPTIVGEGMKRVSLEAAKHPGSVILNNMPKFTGTADQVTSQMMTFNRQWLLQQMRSGRPILDIGLDPNRGVPSIFYQMEQKMIGNYLKLHPNAFQVIKP